MSAIFLLCLLGKALYAESGLPGLISSEYYVSKAVGSDATGTGSLDSPWATINYAVSQIPAGPTEPATLHVALGQYIERVTLPANVNLVGENESPGCTPSEQYSCTLILELRMSGSNRVSGVIFKAFEGPGLVCSGTGAPEIRGCGFWHGTWEKLGEGGPNQVLDSASPAFVDCRFYWNSSKLWPYATGKGGGLWYNSAGQTELIRCVFEGNSADSGGAIYAETGRVVCRDCVFTQNSAEHGASIFSQETAQVTLENCLFYRNYPSRANDIQLHGSGNEITNCTLDATHLLSDATLISGGVTQNSILRGPDIGDMGGEVMYSNVEGYWRGGVGNIDLDPVFVNSASGDYRLQASSPCIDTGTSAEAPDHDLDGNPRPNDIPEIGFDGPGEGFDMGCYEFILQPSATPTATPSPSPTPGDTPTPTNTPTPTETPTPTLGDFNGDGRVDALDLYIFSREWQR